MGADIAHEKSHCGQADKEGQHPALDLVNADMVLVHERIAQFFNRAAEIGCNANEERQAWQLPAGCNRESVRPSW